jgi:DNA-binding SARP family transcriptional activator/tetratricopeptide (TPR) repeat protein
VELGAILARPRLERRLDDVRTRRLGLIIAGAGYGKSTLVAAWAAGRQAAWCSLDGDARDVRVLAQRLIRALGALLPGLPAELDATAQRAGADGDGEEAASRADTLAALLCETLESRLEEDTFLVIDDFHELPAGEPGVRVVEGLVRGAPPRLHLIITSRWPLPFPIERLRGQGQVIELTGDQLRFDRSEVEAILLRLDPPAPGLTDDLMARTEGWPALVRLVVESMRVEVPERRERALQRLVEPGGRLVAYVTEEVLGHEPEAILEVLRIAAGFEPVDADLLEGIGIVDAESVLDDLARRALLVEARSDGPQRIFALHRVVGETVRARLPLPPVELRRLRVRAARWLEAGGRSADAITQLIAAPDPAGVAALLEDHGWDLIGEGSLAAVVDGMGIVPADRRTAALELLLGDALLRRGDWTDAVAALQRAGGDRDPLHPGLAWRIGLIQHEQGDPTTAMATLERADMHGGDPEDLALVAGWLAIVHWQRSDPAGSRPWAEFAMEVAPRAGSDRAMAAAFAAAGAVASMNNEVPRTEELFRQAVAAADRAGDPLIAARFQADLGYVLILEGRYLDALDSLDAAVRLARALGRSTFLALAHCDRGFAHMGLGHLEEADADLVAARALYERIGSDWVAYALMRQGNLHRLRGDTIAARRAYQDALPRAEALGPAWFLAEILIGLGLAVVEDDPVEALALAERATTMAYAGEPAASAALGAAWIAQLAGDGDLALAYATKASEAADERRDRPSAAGALEVRASLEDDPARVRTLLDRAEALWDETGSSFGRLNHRFVRADLLRETDAATEAATVAAAFRRLGARRLADRATDLAERLSAGTRSAVEIRALGTFAVVRGGAPVGPREWQSRKARDLLKVLVVRRGRPTTREQLCELLWPDEDPAPLPNRLSVVLAVIRSVFDPHKRYGPDHFLRADRSAVALDLTNVQVDVEDFMTAAADARRTLERGDPDAALRSLTAAESAYGGELLAEDPYADWATDLREEARATYLEIARRLAARAAATGDADAAVRLYLRILEPDPYDEDAHLGLIRALAAAGRHGEARRRYDVYAARMAELDVEAVPYPSGDGATPLAGASGAASGIATLSPP